MKISAKLSLLVAAALCLCDSVAKSQVNFIGVFTTTNGVLIAPTNIFAANLTQMTNALAAAGYAGGTSVWSSGNNYSTNTIVCVGDSITAGLGGQYNRWPDVLSDMTGAGNYNLGLSGFSSGMIMTNYLALLAAIPAFSNNPTIFEMGTDDTGDGYATNVTIPNIAACVARLSPSAPYWVLTIDNATNEYPGAAGLGWTNYIAKTNLDAAILATYGAHAIDIRHWLVTHGNLSSPGDVWAASNDVPALSLINPDPALYGLHPNDAGYLQY